MQWSDNEYTISDEYALLDIALIHEFLRNTYWAKAIPRETVIKALENSLCFGLFHHDKQISFGRVVTDRATFAYLSDVFVIDSYRGRVLGKWLISCILDHPELQGLRRWLLATLDAHGLYRQHGFASLHNPERFMEVNNPDIYLHAT
jgi:GNAT superfamily N-acetyltransferase